MKICDTWEGKIYTVCADFKGNIWNDRECPSVVLFFSATLSGLGLKLNPYEGFIANKVIGEHQCTIGWFLDDNKVSQMDDSFNSIIADNIKEKIGKLYHTKWNKHNFLSVDIEFIAGKKFTVSTPHHVEEALEDFFETLKVNVVNPATSQLSTITSEAKELDDEKGLLSLDNFQNLVDNEVFTVRLGNSGFFFCAQGCSAQPRKVGGNLGESWTIWKQQKMTRG